MFYKVMLRMKNKLGSTVLLNLNHVIQVSPGPAGKYAEITLLSGVTYHTCKEFEAVSDEIEILVRANG